MRYLILLLAFLSGGASADLTEKQSDILMHTVTGLIIIDWGLSLDIENHSNLEEGNMIIGDNPSRRSIHLFSISKLALHYFANKTKSRNAWNITTIILTGHGVRNNLSLGLKINF